MWARIKEKIIQFFKWIKKECKDTKTLILFGIIVVIMYSPVWLGYLLFGIFKWTWCSVLASAYLAFWAGPFTPFFPCCIAATLAIKRIMEKLKEPRKPEKDGAEATINT